jgi:hypothetical protein
MIRLVLFDAFATLIKPRRPIATQYSEIFGTVHGKEIGTTKANAIPGPFFVLKEEDIKLSFKTGMQLIGSVSVSVSCISVSPNILAALRELQDKKPVYSHVDGVQGWWGEVIRQTALGAGADPIGTRRHCTDEAVA